LAIIPLFQTSIQSKKSGNEQDFFRVQHKLIFKGDEFFGKFVFLFKLFFQLFPCHHYFILKKTGKAKLNFKLAQRVD